ncbi:Arabinose metabolism transcriptional repressor [Flagellimonas maritima]|uniref:Arabinose metabolism transcriptional repressor n=1 Tax=Flagellimonas maritima TaxID=1383885 RepID=A0A2Z4LQN0_9FLAO|nr:GntR family transcriptional regulator [Allomuricauda aurantiaca]AWX43708.1 Arabinose metabolism transcriptional repressor [Allomuricauda aurantiaca]
MAFNSIEHIKVDVNSRIPKYRQIVDSIMEAIGKGFLEKGEKIPSINEVSEECLLSRDTVEKAYGILRKQNIIESVKGKGYYVARADFSSKTKVLFLINKLSSYKMRIFNSFVQALGSKAQVDVYIYHCEPSVFKNILAKKAKEYDQFVIMPHFKNENLQHMGCTDEILEVVRKIPEEKLIIMDRNILSLSMKAGRIYQDFSGDIYAALSIGLDKLKKYQKIILVYPSKSVYPYPKGIVTGFKKFCIEHTFDYEVLDEIYDSMELQLKDLFIIIEETDLVNLVKQLRDRHYKFGEDIGIISYNDTPLKELLGITVISTDFTKMGTEAAKMILENKKTKKKNDFNLIDRHSV